VADRAATEADFANSCLRSWKAAIELWRAAKGILAAFAAFIVTFIKHLPGLLVAGFITRGGVSIINRLDESLVHLPTAFRLNSQ